MIKNINIGTQKLFYDIGFDLDQTCLTHQMVFLKEFVLKLILNKNQQTLKKHEKKLSLLSVKAAQQFENDVRFKFISNI